MTVKRMDNVGIVVEDLDGAIPTNTLFTQQWLAPGADQYSDRGGRRG